MIPVFVSNVQAYTGPGAVAVLRREGFLVIGHDVSFTDTEARAAFEAEGPGIALAAQTADDIADALAALPAELGERKAPGQGAVERFVFNDIYPNTPMPIEEIDPDALAAAHAALVGFPFRLCQRIIPGLKAARSGSIVFVTSARVLQPEAGFTLATSVRAGATALSQAVARELAPFNIQVNAVQPNYLYSELYYPRARFIDDPEGAAEIAAKVPAGRLGNPEEVGELITFTVSGRAPFMTGQVLNFTGGWP